MATLITPTVIASRALATLYNTTVFAQLVNRDYDSDFDGKIGDTITVRKPASFVAKVFDRNTGIELQDPTETSFDVTLDTLLDVSFPVTTEELTLELTSFDERLLTPAMEAIVQDVDARLAEAVIDAAEGAGGGGTVTMGATPSTLYTGENGAVAKLGRAKAPLMNRYSVVSPELQGVHLSEELFVAADKSGTTDALRNASIARAFGFDIYATQVMGYGTGDKAHADGAAFHRDALALVSRTLEKPMGLSDGQFAVNNYKGLGLRVVQDYDINKKQDVISIDFLIGVEAVRPEWAIQLNASLGS